ncbi:MAG: hypothetical protein LBQ15_06085, partial [Clostridium sp.]|nr:hypothetical protein [Clostridium sp.]
TGLPVLPAASAPYALSMRGDSRRSSALCGTLSFASCAAAQFSHFVDVNKMVCYLKAAVPAGLLGFS